jgi:hypothetical protein
MKYETRYFDGDTLVAKHGRDVTLTVLDNATGRFIETRFHPTDNEYQKGLWKDFVKTINEIDQEAQ